MVYMFASLRKFIEALVRKDLDVNNPNNTIMLLTSEPGHLRHLEVFKRCRKLIKCIQNPNNKLKSHILNKASSDVADFVLSSQVTPVYTPWSRLHMATTLWSRHYTTWAPGNYICLPPQQRLIVTDPGLAGTPFEDSDLNTRVLPRKNWWRATDIDVLDYTPVVGTVHITGENRRRAVQRCVGINNPGSWFGVYLYKKDYYFVDSQYSKPNATHSLNPDLIPIDIQELLKESA